MTEKRGRGRRQEARDRRARLKDERERRRPRRAMVPFLYSGAEEKGRAPRPPPHHQENDDVPGRAMISTEVRRSRRRPHRHHAIQTIQAIQASLHRFLLCRRSSDRATRADVDGHSGKEPAGWLPSPPSLRRRSASSPRGIKDGSHRAGREDTCQARTCTETAVCLWVQKERWASPRPLAGSVRVFRHGRHSKG